LSNKRSIPWVLIGAVLLLAAGTVLLFSRASKRNAPSPTISTPTLPAPGAAISTLSPLPAVIDPSVPLQETTANYEVITRENAARLELLGQVGEGILRDDFDLSPDGKTLVIVSGGGIILADAETMTRIGFIPVLGGAREVAISPDGSRVAVTHNQVGSERVNTQGAGEITVKEALLSIYDLNNRQLQTRIRLREGGCAGTSAENPRFSGNGQKILVSGFVPRNLSEGGGALCLYSVTDGNLEHIFQPRDAYGGFTLFNRKGTLLYTLAFEGGNRVTSNRVTALDLTQKRPVRDYPIPLDNVQYALLSNDDQRLLLGDLHRIGWLNLSDGSWKALTLPDLENQTIEQMAMTGGGSLIAFVTAFQGKIYLLDGDSGTTIWGPLDSARYPTWDGREVQQYALPSAKMLISPDGQTLYQLFEGYSLRKLSLLDGSQQAILGGQSEPHIYAVKPDASQVAFGGYADHSVRVWSVMENLELFALEGHSGMVWGVAYSPEGSQIGTASEDGSLKLWDAKTGALLRTLNANTGAAWALDFSSGGKLLASCGDDNQLRVWDPQKGTLLKTLTIGGNGQSHRILKFLPGNNSVLIASYCFRGETCPVEAFNGELLQIDLNTGQILAQDSDMTFGLEISLDGQFMGTVSDRRGWCFGNPLTNPSGMRCLSNGYTGNGVSPDGTMYFSTNGQSIQVYESGSGNLITELSPGMDYGRTRISSDQKILWISSHRLQFWGIPHE